jgi:hypothetical protein
MGQEQATTQPACQRRGAQGTLWYTSYLIPAGVSCMRSAGSADEQPSSRKAWEPALGRMQIVCWV